MEKQKQNRAITLIALIITVIVILILAGVSINFIMGQESIFSKTQSATDTYNKQAAIEAMEIELAEVRTKIYADYRRRAELQDYANELEKKIEVEYVKLGRAKASIDVTGYSSILVKLKAYSYEFEIGETGIEKIDGEDYIKITGITLNKEKLGIFKNETYALSIIDITPENSKLRTVVWRSSDPKVVTVNENGLVTGVSDGTAVITAIPNGDDSVIATCSVTVNEIVKTEELEDDLKTTEGARKYIGKTVNNYNAEGFAWQIYDITSSGNILLICKDNVNSDLKTLKEFTNASSYSESMTYLSNTKNWEKYVDYDLGGISAVGAPSIAQYNTSANKTGGFAGGRTWVGVNNSSAAVYNDGNVYYNTSYRTRLLDDGRL